MASKVAVVALRQPSARPARAEHELANTHISSKRCTADRGADSSQREAFYHFHTHTKRLFPAKLQRAGAVQDARAVSGRWKSAPASWTAVALYRFPRSTCPPEHAFHSNHCAAERGADSSRREEFHH